MESNEFKITPRKGQFLVLKTKETEEEDKTLHCVIEPTPTQFTKGVIVWRTIYGNLIVRRCCKKITRSPSPLKRTPNKQVGPTAEPQSDREDRSTHKDTIEMLRKHAEKVVPSLMKDATVRRVRARSARIIITLLILCYHENITRHSLISHEDQDSDAHSILTKYLTRASRSNTGTWHLQWSASCNTTSRLFDSKIR